MFPFDDVIMYETQGVDNPTKPQQSTEMPCAYFRGCSADKFRIVAIHLLIITSRHILRMPRQHNCRDMRKIL